MKIVDVVWTRPLVIRDCRLVDTDTVRMIVLLEVDWLFRICR